MLLSSFFLWTAINFTISHLTKQSFLIRTKLSAIHKAEKKIQYTVLIDSKYTNGYKVILLSTKKLEKSIECYVQVIVLNVSTNLSYADANDLIVYN